MVKKNKTAIIALLLPLLVLTYIFFGGSVGISLDFGEDILTVRAEKQRWNIPYEQITALELVEHADYGTLLNGSEKKTLRCGTYVNDRWGQYTLCIDPRIENCIVIEMDDSFFVLNYESNDVTKQLHTMFTQLMAVNESTVP